MSEQKIYTLLRMTSATELLGTFVFSEHRKGSKTSAFSEAETAAETNQSDQASFYHPTLPKAVGSAGFVESDLSLQDIDIEQGTTFVRTTVPPSSGAFNVGSISHDELTSSAGGGFERRMELPQRAMIDKAGPPTVARQGLFSCTCKPCSPAEDVLRARARVEQLNAAKASAEKAAREAQLAVEKLDRQLQDAERQLEAAADEDQDLYTL
jgi:hypothetical protein